MEAIVFIFPDSADHTKIGRVAVKAKEIFEESVTMHDVKVHAVRGRAAETVAQFLTDGIDPEESNLVKHAIRELSMINNDEEFNEALVNSVRAFANYGHSGGSASVAIPLLNELLQYHNLSPLTDDPGEWMEVTDGQWQSTRNPEAFSENQGKTYRLLSTGDKVYDSQRMYRAPEEGP